MDGENTLQNQACASHELWPTKPLDSKDPGLFAQTGSCDTVQYILGLRQKASD